MNNTVAVAVADAHARLAAYGDPALAISLVPGEHALDGTTAGLPLCGLPFAVKDNVDVADVATTAGCPSFAYTPERDAAVVARLRAAGAVPVCKTNLDQFATGLVGTRSPYGTPRNPLDSGRVPGGSSSGSVVAVAAGIVPFAIGTDTAGSGRVPAAFTGIVGLKPTRGRVSTRGIVPAVRSLDCPSIFAGTVAEAWAVLEACTGFDPGDAYSRTPGPDAEPVAVPRVGVLEPEVVRSLCDAPTARAYACTVESLGQLGCPVARFAEEPFLAAGRLLYDGPWVAERYAAVGGFLDAHRADPGVDPTVARIILAARDLTAVDAYEGAYRLAALRRETEFTWDRVDLLALPTAPVFPTLADVAADPVGVNARLGTFTAFVNLLDLCAISVPGTARDDGLPFGLSLIAPAGADARIAAVAARLLGEPAPVARGNSIELVVAGAHLSGQPLNRQLTDVGARFGRATRTAPAYRLYALAGTSPPKPGLVRVEAGGRALDVETWTLDPGAFGRFVAGVPAPMCIGTVELEDGSTPKGFLCEARALDCAEDITRFGGWRAYLDARSA